jgi:hypothetical protein
MSDIFWGTPHKHVPKIDGIQFYFHGAYMNKGTAQRIAAGKRKDGLLARVQKKTITSLFGKKRKVTSHCYVVFIAQPDRVR